MKPSTTKSTSTKPVVKKRTRQSKVKAPSPEPEPEVEVEAEAEASNDEDDGHLHGFSTDDDDSSDEEADIPEISTLDVSKLPTIAKDDATVKRKLEKAKRVPVRPTALPSSAVPSDLLLRLKIAGSSTSAAYPTAFTKPN